MIRCFRIAKPNAQDLKAINALLTELSSRRKKLTPRRYAEMLRDKNTFLIAAKSKGAIVGMGTLILMRSPSGVEAYVDDVVVLKKFRGQGIGKTLIQKLVALAQAKKADFIELTSNPSRVEANALYQKLGFSKRETNVYRLSCE